MSRKTYPNRDALRQANDIYLDAMRPFIVHHLKQIQGETVEDLIENALKPEQADKFREKLDEDDDIESAIDFSYFPQIIQRQWQNAFGQRFNGDRNFQSMLWLIRKGRNSCEHRGTKDLDVEFVRMNLFLIADVLGKINRPDEQLEVEGIRDKLFDDTIAVEAEKVKYEKSIAEVEESLAAAEENNKKLLKQRDDKTAELDRKKEELEKLKENEKRLNSTSKQLEKVQAAHSTCEERLTSTEAERDNYKEHLETTSKDLEEAKKEWQACEDSLAAMRNLFTAWAIGNNMVFPPFETDFTVRILDRRGVNKRNFLLDLLRQKQPAIIYVQSGDKIKELEEQIPSVL